MLKGSIFVYNESYQTIAYTNNIKSKYSIILVGGLNHNILSLPYTSDLNAYCIEKEIELVIPQFRSHPNYGIYTIDDDVEDIRSLLSVLDTKIILIGNSSGCQSIVLYLDKYRNKNIVMCILQAPVSDVEYEEHINKNLEKNLQVARDCEKKSHEIDFDLVLPFKHENNYITAKRHLSLFERNGKEDLFSSYLSCGINNLFCKTVFVMSGKDEFSANGINYNLSKSTNSKFYILDEADHFLTRKSTIENFIQILNEEIQEILNNG